MDGRELYNLAKSGANIAITVQLPEMLEMIQEADRAATARTLAEEERKRMAKQEALTREEFCGFWKISERTFTNWINKKVVHPNYVGGLVRIAPEEQARLLQQSRI